LSRRVLVVANDHVGSTMAGPGIRSFRFATELANEHDVTLIVPFATDLADERITIVQDDPWDARRMNRRVDGFDVVVAQKLPVMTMTRLARSRTVAIYDLYAPLSVEELASHSREPRSPQADAAWRLTALTQEVALRCGDAFVCASPRQRDFWLGSLLGLGRVDQEVYDADRSLRHLIDVVPFGIDEALPEPSSPVLKGVVPGIGPDDRVLLWGGGIWNWFDPLTVIRAVGVVSRERPDIRLFFMGLRHPNPAVAEMEMERRALALAEELGLRDRTVFFNERWVPYASRGQYYLEADLGVSAHFDELEARLSFRTRLLDCVWAGLPMVTTRGDSLGAFVEERGLGRTVPPGDVDAWAAALTELLENDEERRGARERIATVRSQLTWTRTVVPLHRLVATAGKAGRPLPPRLVSSYLSVRAGNAVRLHGFLGAASRAARSLTGRAAPLGERVRTSVR
jgi:glycosyltransferase involved in cell wall biosynthesis